MLGLMPDRLQVMVQDLAPETGYKSLNTLRTVTSHVSTGLTLRYWKYFITRKDELHEFSLESLGALSYTRSLNKNRLYRL